MARFILDIANLSDEQILNAMHTVQDTFSDTVCSICCIDKSNDGQFYSDDETLLVRSGSWIYNVTSQPDIYYQMAH